MLNTSYGIDCEISIEDSIKILQAIARKYDTSQVYDAVNVAIMCMRKVEKGNE